MLRKECEEPDEQSAYDGNGFRSNELPEYTTYKFILFHNIFNCYDIIIYVCGKQQLGLTKSFFDIYHAIGFCT